MNSSFSLFSMSGPWVGAWGLYDATAGGSPILGFFPPPPSVCRCAGCAFLYRVKGFFTHMYDTPGGGYRTTGIPEYSTRSQQFLQQQWPQILILRPPRQQEGCTGIPAIEPNSTPQPHHPSNLDNNPTRNFDFARHHPLLLRCGYIIIWTSQLQQSLLGNRLLQ